MSETVAITLTDEQQKRLARLVEHLPDLGNGGTFSLIEDEVCRLVWNALTA